MLTADDAMPLSSRFQQCFYVVTLVHLGGRGRVPRRALGCRGRPSSIGRSEEADRRRSAVRRMCLPGRACTMER
ncbi:hypothetical protein FM106_19230 [Brachybacterium faecium]|nr:hypothetical protein FM106_19230 [Brachybacterium faecium]